MERFSRRAALRLGARLAIGTAVGAQLGAGSLVASVTRAAAAGGTVEVLQPWSGDNGGARAMAALVKRYFELRPDVTVKNTAVGAEYEGKQIAAFASGRVPDVTLVFAEMLPAYADRGALTPVDDRIARDGVALSDYFDVAAAQLAWAGRVYGLPHHPDLRTVLYRNGARLTGAGIDPDQEPASWAELRDAGARTTRRDGGRAAAGWLPISGDVPWALQYALGNGASLLDPDGAHAAFDNPAVVEAIGFVVDATDKIVGLSDAAVGQATFRGGPGQETDLAAGGLAYAVGGNWYLDRLAANADVAGAVRISLFPGGPSAPWPRITLAGGVVQTIPQGAKNADAAWEYLRWVAGPEGQRLIQSVSYDVAGLRAAAHDPDAIAAHLGRAQLVEALESTGALAYPPTPVWPRLRAEMERVQRLALLRQLSPAQAAQELQARTQALLDSNRATGRALYGRPPAAGDAPVPAAADPANRLRNPGFEGGSYRAGLSSSVAADWSRWFQHRGADEPGYWMPEPEFGVLAKGDQAHGGGLAQRWFTSYAVHNGGVSQTVAVPAGAWLRFSAFLFGWSSQGDAFGKSEGAHFRAVGIDPDGGTDPFDPRIVWSPADATMDRWAQLAVVAQARRDRVTVFVRSQADLAYKHNDVLLDDAALTLVAPPADADAALLAAGAVDPTQIDLAAALAGATDVTRGTARGSLAGSAAGAHAYFGFEYPGGEVMRRIAVQASLDTPAGLARFGFRVYGPRWGDVYTMSALRIGAQPNVVAVLPAGEAGRYLIDVHNYNPTGLVDFQISLLTK
jgi:multiple sugar transport system substrate-binding protein